jgi:hypothetical protein
MRRKIKLGKVNCERGAPMGRVSSKLGGDRITIELMRMSRCGAYDSGGAYWGCGSREHGWMYVAEDEDGDQAFVRARSILEAMEKLANE